MSNFNIIDVVDYLGIPRVGRNNNPNEVKVQCIYCGDSRGKATVKVMKDGKLANLYHCWSCGKGGNMTTLYYDKKGGFSTYKEAYNDMLEKVGKKECKPSYTQQKKVNKTFKRASDQVLDRTYRQMLSFIRLKKADKDDLLKRTLTEEEIQRGMFRSTPSDTTGICRKLLKAGCVLEGVPGFYKNKSNEWTLNVYRNEGYFCPVFRGEMIVGMQIRLNNPKDGAKYIWLSSADRYFGTSAGTPSSFYGSPDAATVIVIEGILKSYVTHCLWPDVAIIGTPGVAALNDVDRILKKNNHKILVEAYDMDKRQNLTCRNDYKKETCQKCRDNKGCYYNSRICRCEKKNNKVLMINKAIERLKKIASENKLAVKSFYWDEDPITGLWLENYKGIDDFLAESRKGGRYGINKGNTNTCGVPGRRLSGGHL